MHTPFTRFLVTKRHEKEVRQQDLAARLKVGPSYLCALEAGRRLPRSKAFLKSLGEALTLNAAEMQELFDVAERSRSTVAIPASASWEVRGLVHDLATRGEFLDQEQLEIMRILLKKKSTKRSEEIDA